MILETVTVTAFQQNTRIAACAKTGRAVCIDPGGEGDRIVEAVNKLNVELQAIVLTHAHLDHVGAALDVHRAFPNAEIILHHDDEELYYGLQQQPLFLNIPRDAWASMGFDYEPPPRLTRNWVHGEIYVVGTLQFKVLHCPGHTRGHVVLAEETERKVFVGDCLFAGSVGRTDLPGGSHEQLMESIRNNILTLGDDVTVYSGHGEETTVGREKQTNPFLTGAYQINRGRFV
jgi:hydroxyacylglutathione hydrolase